jgi:hypothetical protein
MSDEAKKEDKHDGKAAEAGAKKKSSLPLGAIGAVVVLLGIGAGIGMFLSSLVKPAPAPAAEPGTEGHGDAGKDGHPGTGKGGKDGKPGDHGSILAHAVAFPIGDLMTNVRGQQGRRFIKMTCVLWMDHDAVAKTASGGGGGHGGSGADPADNIKAILQAAFEEHLKTYDLEDLTSVNIYKLLERNFKEITDRELRALYPDIKSTEPIVARVVLTNMLVQ